MAEQRLIDAEAFVQTEIDRCGCIPFVGTCTMNNEYLPVRVRKAPTIEAKPVVHAHWEEQNDGTHFCSRCGNDATYTYEGKELVGFLCPFCGAQMDEVVEENATTTNNTQKVSGDDE